MEVRLVLAQEEAYALARWEPVREQAKYTNPMEVQVAGLPPAIAVPILGHILSDAWKWLPASTKNLSARLDVEFRGLEPSLLGLVDAEGDEDRVLRKVAHYRRVRLGQMAYWGRFWRDRKQGGLVVEVRSDDGLVSMRMVVVPEEERAGLTVDEVARMLTQKLSLNDQQEAVAME